MKLRHAPFLLPCIAMWVLDAAVTLVGQPAAYWLGNYAAAHEVNPIFRQLLVLGPWVFWLGVIANIAIVFIVLRFLGPTMASSILFLATVLHYAAAGTWIIRIPYVGILLFLLIGIAVKIFLEREWDRFAALSDSAD